MNKSLGIITLVVLATLTAGLAGCFRDEQPLLNFCGALQTLPPEERVRYCADHNTTGSIEFGCYTHPYVDGHGKVQHIFAARFPGDSKNRCTVEA